VNRRRLSVYIVDILCVKLENKCDCLGKNKMLNIAKLRLKETAKARNMGFVPAHSGTHCPFA
jgi:hypothetical protein